MRIGRLAIQAKDGEPIFHFSLGDFHVGNVNHDADALARAVAFILAAKKEHRHVYVHLTGDLLDCIVPNAKDKRWDPAEVAPDFLIQDLKDLAAAQARRLREQIGAIAALVTSINKGNHEGKFVQIHGNDIYSRELLPMFPRLAETNGDMGPVGLFSVAIDCPGGPFRFQLALKHGDGGGGMLEGYPVTAIAQNFRRFSAADVCIMGHIHKLARYPDRQMELDGTGRNFTERKRWLGTAGCFLATHRLDTENYFEHKRGTVSDIGMLQVTMAITRRKVNGTRNRTKTTTMEEIWLR